MVETITPVVHGGRTSRWARFLALHAAGATLAAAAFGAALGGAGALLGAPWGAAGLAAVAVLAGAYLAGEALGVRVPVPQLRRQVPDWWRTFFPFGPASFLYGVGLGVGFLTYLTHGTLVVVAAAAAASGRPLLGALVLAPFGLARGLSGAVAMRARTPDEGAELVGRLARSSSWAAWRVAHAAVLAAVLGTAIAAGAASEGTVERGGIAATILVLAFGAAGVAKLARGRTWRRALASYGLPAPMEQVAAAGVPLLELGIAVLPFLGLARAAGVAALGTVVAFSGAIVVGRVRVGARMACGCFGSAAVRDYRLLLARNAALALAAFVAWRDGVNAPPDLGVPSGSELLPATLVVLGLGLATWAGVAASLAMHRGARR